MTKLIGIKPAIPKHIERMLEESNELAQRLMAIETFTESETFAKMHDTDRHLLTVQGSIMQAYLRVLTMRVERANTLSNAN